MSRTRALAVMGAVALAVLVPVGPAHAATASEAPAAAGYFNRAAVAKPDASPQAPPNLARSADGVAEGNLAVAAQAGTEDKVSFLFFPLSDLPPGATITKATVTVPLVPNDNGNVTVNAAPERVVACKILGSGFSTEDGEALSVAPERDCPTFMVAGAPSADGLAYTFDVTSLATAWLEVNDGLALTRNPDQSDNFQVVFTRDAKLDYEFSGGEPLPTIADLTASLEAPSFDAGSSTSGSVDSGTSSFDSGTSSFDSGTSSFDSGTATSDFGGGFGSAETPDLAAADSAVTEPEVAEEEPSVALPPTRRAGAFDVPLTPSVGFFVVGVLMAGLLALLSLIMGDPRLPPAADARQSRLSQALSRRASTFAPPQA